MRLRRRHALEVLSISALDIFASALGVFILVAIVLFPFYLKQPSIEAALLGAEAELAATQTAVTETEEELREAEAERLLAEAAIQAAQARLQQAEAAAAAAAQELEKAEAAGGSTVVAEPPVGLRSGPPIPDLDLVFVLDTTGSMRRELEDLQANLIGVIRVLHKLAASLNIGFVAFKDRGDDYVTREFPLAAMEGPRVDEIIRFVDVLRAGGGGDDPEPADDALSKATAMTWRPNAQGRIIVIGDAPAHVHRQRRAFDLAAGFARSTVDPARPRSVSAILTGNARVSERFFRKLAQAGRGDFFIHQGQMIESILLTVLPKEGVSGL